MNLRPILFSLFLVAIVAALGVFWASTDRGDAQDSASLNVPPVPDSAPDPVLPTMQESATTVDVNSPDVARRERNPDVTLALSGGPRQGECEWVTTYVTLKDTGEQIAAQKQVCENEIPRHPYDEYTSATLEGMAYSDPFAALVLGKRLTERDPTEAWNLMLRGAALLDDGDPLTWLATVSYSTTFKNDAADIRSIEHHYVLTSTANRISGVAIDPLDRYRAAEVHELSDEDIRRLDQVVETQLRRVRAIQNEFPPVSP